MGMGQLCLCQHTHVKVVLPLCHLPLNPRGRKQFDYHGGIVNPQPAVLAMAAYMARPGSRDQETYLSRLIGTKSIKNWFTKSIYHTVNRLRSFLSSCHQVIIPLFSTY